MELTWGTAEREAKDRITWRKGVLHFHQWIKATKKKKNKIKKTNTPISYIE